jgi:alanine dehydrogenase
MIRSLSVLRESKVDAQGREVENRVIFIPSLLKEIKTKCPKIEIYVEKDAGAKIDFPNHAYEEVGAKIVSHDEALTKDFVLGVKETRIEDFPKLRDNLWLSYQHFAQSKERTELAVKESKEKGTIFMALETMEETREGHPFFPCLASEALGTMVLPYVVEIINQSLEKAAEENLTIRSGINIKEGKIVHPGLASVFPYLK